MKTEVRHRMLTPNIMAVASVNHDLKHWRVYCGVSETDEAVDRDLILKYGGKLDQDVAEAVFPEFKAYDYQR